MTNRLKRGVPDGYKPQRQAAPSSAVVLVSEWARKATHELNDKHHNWIEARLKDEFADENLSEAQIRNALDHTALLMSYKQVKEYLPKVERDHQMIVSYVAYLNSNRGFVGRRKVTTQQWAAHKLAQQEEMAYKLYLYRVLKERLKQFNRAANNNRHEISVPITTDNQAASALFALIHKIVARAEREVMSDEEQRVLDRVGDFLFKRQAELVEEGAIFADDHVPFTVKP